MTVTDGLPLRMAQLLYQRTAAAVGTVKLDGCMGDMKLMRQFMLNTVEQALTLACILRLNFHMSGKSKNMSTDRPNIEMVDIGNTFDTSHALRNLIHGHSSWHPFHQNLGCLPQNPAGTDQYQQANRY